MSWSNIKAFFTISEQETLSSMVKISAYNNYAFSKIAFKQSNEDFEIMLIALDYQKLVENLVSMDSLSKIQSSNFESINNELYIKLENRLKKLGIYQEVSDIYDRVKSTE